jgi:flagellar basal body-associated protein FliL
MQKKIWVIILTVLIFLSGATLGFTTVFRVSDVVVEVSASSADAETEAQELRARLKELYAKENIFFVKDEKNFNNTDDAFCSRVCFM